MSEEGNAKKPGSSPAQKEDDGYASILNNSGPSLEEYNSLLEADNAKLQNLCKAKDAEYSACKAKIFQVDEQYLEVCEKAESARMDFNMTLKILYMPASKDVSPLFEQHFNLVNEFCCNTAETSTKITNEGKKMLTAIRVPEHRYLNIQSSIVDMANSKKGLLQEYNKCYEEVQSLEKTQFDTDNYLRGMSDFGSVTLEARTETLELLKNCTTKKRKMQRDEYLKNAALSNGQRSKMPKNA